MEKKNLGVFSVMGAESPFGYFPRHVALLAGIAAALLLAPGVKISDKVDILTENMGRSGVMMIVLIYLMASGFQGAAAALRLVLLTCSRSHRILLF